ncbi:MAG: leucine-rich repeat domain-containing protein [Bacteroidaceae bacterium]|nr:leucine-rich repeat domain-containing protein [Bacteroidaceae bacterium]
MKRLQIFVATLLLAGVELPVLAQTYNPDSLKNVGGWLTGSDLKYSGTSAVSNGGTVDKNGSNHYYGDVFIKQGTTTLEKRESGTQGGAGSFQYSYITTATIPASVNLIEDAAFSDCIFLQNIYVDDANTTYFDVDGVVYKWLTKDASDPFNPEKNSFQLVSVPGAKTNVTILEGTTSIGPCAFDGCSKITAVIIPASVTEIHQYAFTGTALSSLTCMGETPPAVYGKYSDWGFFDRNYNSHGLYEMEVGVIKVPYGTSAVYKDANRWDNYDDKVVEMPKIEEEVLPQVEYVQHIEKIFLRDSENYTRTEPHTIGNEIRREEVVDGINTTINIYYSSAATYERTFYNDKWQALYAPFIIKYGDYRTDMLEVAEIKSVTEYLDADNNITWFYLTAEVLDSGDEIPAHTPCVVRTISANDAGVGRDIDLFKGVDSHTSARILEPAETKTMVLTSSNGNQYNLVGQYTRRNTATIQAEDGVDYKEIYAMAGGTLKKAGGANVTLGAYRWYLSIEPAAGNSIMMFKFGNFNQGNATSVDEIVVDSDADRSDNIYYDLSGRAVDNPVKGIYIYNGKKVYLDR